MVKKLEINIDYNIRLCLIFKASHLWEASRIWVIELRVDDGMNRSKWKKKPMSCTSDPR